MNTTEDWGFILQDADYRARTEKTPLSAADRSVLKSALVEEAVKAARRWYRPNQGYTLHTYTNAVMEAQQKRIVARILRQKQDETPNIDIPADPSDPLSATIAELQPDERETASRVLPRVDWDMVLNFFTPEEFRIFEARLHNVPCAAIARELGYTPGKWKRIWRSFQKRAAFILDLTQDGRGRPPSGPSIMVGADHRAARGTKRVARWSTPTTKGESQNEK